MCQQSWLKDAVRQRKCESKWPRGLKPNWLILFWSSSQIFTTVENLLQCSVTWLLSMRPLKAQQKERELFCIVSFSLPSISHKTMHLLKHDSNRINHVFSFSISQACSWYQDPQTGVHHDCVSQERSTQSWLQGGIYTILPNSPIFFYYNMGKLEENLIVLKWWHDDWHLQEEEKPETHQGKDGGWKASSPFCFWVVFLFCFLCMKSTPQSAFWFSICLFQP